MDDKQFEHEADERPRDDDQQWFAGIDAAETVDDAVGTTDEVDAAEPVDDAFIAGSAEVRRARFTHNSRIMSTVLMVPARPTDNDMCGIFKFMLPIYTCGGTACRLHVVCPG